MAARILIVDDEVTQLRLMEAVTQRLGYDAETANDGTEAVERLTHDKEKAIELVILDLSMPKMGGIEVLKKIRPMRPELPVIVLTAHASVTNVVEAMKAGATDFVAKPASAERIRTAIKNALQQNALVGELEPVTEAMGAEMRFDDLVGESLTTKEAISVAKKAAQSSIPVLIEGESGVGKELFARAIQSSSARRDKPFITVNCGAIPDNLVESILFGHEKGSFTGANEKHVGKFEEANGGTLFLDEIGELPQDIQVKLLRALQDGEIDPVGARRSVKVDIRLISATNRDLARQVERGEFREDLYYRLNVFPIRVPPLRQRREDIPTLVDHFLKRIASSEGLSQKRVSPAALELLMAHDWPGNIRQLQNAVFRAAILCDEEILQPHDFPQILARSRREGASGDGGQAVSDGESSAAAISDDDHVGLTGPDGHVRPLAEVEKETIRLALKRYGGRMTEVARRLAIGRSTLYRKIAEFGLDKRGDDADGADSPQGT